MLNTTNTAENTAAVVATDPTMPAKPAKPKVDKPALPENVEHEVSTAAVEAAHYASQEAGYRADAVTAHANAAWLYMLHVTCETDVSVAKMRAASFGAAFKSAYAGARNASEDASKKALSRVKATATRAYDADCTGPEDVAKLGTQTAADKAADAKRKGEGKRGGAIPAGLAEPAGHRVADNVGDYDAAFAAMAAFVDIFKRGQFKPQTGGDAARIKGLLPVIETSIRKHSAASAIA